MAAKRTTKDPRTQLKKRLYDIKFSEEVKAKRVDFEKVLKIAKELKKVFEDASTAQSKPSL